MTAIKVRADYEQLAQIAQAFSRQAETAQHALNALQQGVSTLQAGDWVGKGADAFYAEMNSAVLPAMKRVVSAMNSAVSTTTRISRIMKQAEADAAAVFRLDDAAANNALAVGGVQAGGASALVRGKAGSGKAGPPPIMPFSWRRAGIAGSTEPWRNHTNSPGVAGSLYEFDREVINKIYQDLPGANELFNRLYKENWKIIKGTTFNIDRKAHTITINAKDTINAQATSIMLGVTAALS